MEATQTHPCTVCGDPLSDDEGVYASTAFSAANAKLGIAPLRAYWVCVTCMFLNDAVLAAERRGKDVT